MRSRTAFSLFLVAADPPLASCRQPPRPAQISQAERSAIAQFIGTLKHDPALFLVIRPNRLYAGAEAIERLLRSLKPAELEALYRALPEVSSNGASGLWQLARIFADGVPKDLRGWDQSRPILAALDGTGRDEDLSLLFRAFLVDQGKVPPLALHHSISIPATDSHALVEALAHVLEGNRFAPLPRGASGAAFFALADYSTDSGFVALSAQEHAVRVEVVTDESPAVSEKARSAESRAALLAQPPDTAGTVAPFEELEASGGDAVVAYLRTRNFFRRNFVRWLGAAAEIRLLPNPTDKDSVLAKGAAELLAGYPLMSQSQPGAAADLALGLDLNGGVGVRIALQDPGGDRPKGRKERSGSEHRVQLPLPSILDAGWYRAAAATLGVDGVQACQIRDILESGGNYVMAFVLATDPDRALPALAANHADSPSGRFPVQWTAGLGSKPERTPGAACLARAAQAMRAHFEVLSKVDPSDELQSERRLADLDRALDCATSDRRLAGQAQAIRLAHTLVKAERLAAGLHRDEAAQLLAPACSAGQPEACARANALRTAPRIRLPVVRTCSEWSLPPPGAQVVTLDRNGRLYESTGRGSNPPVVIEADKDARHAVVVAALKRFGRERVVWAGTIDPKGAIRGVPVLLTPSDSAGPTQAMSVLRYPTSHREATLIRADGKKQSIAIADSCAASPPCSLAVALKDLQAPSSGVPPVVFLDIAGRSTWSETLMIIANAFCLDSSGAPIDRPRTLRSCRCRLWPQHRSSLAKRPTDMSIYNEVRPHSSLGDVTPTDYFSTVGLEA